MLLLETAHKISLYIYICMGICNSYLLFVQQNKSVFWFVCNTILGETLQQLLDVRRNIWQPRCDNHLISFCSISRPSVPVQFQYFLPTYPPSAYPLAAHTYTPITSSVSTIRQYPGRSKSNFLNYFAFKFFASNEIHIDQTLFLVLYLLILASDKAKTWRF